MKYTYNKEYLMRDEKPWFPVMGEFHYSRYRDDLWEESLQENESRWSHRGVNLCILDPSRGRGRCV